MKKRTITLIAGPTASGKSDLALRWARQNSGVIINADSMQVYSLLPVLTAQPSADDMALVPHYLYGHVAPTCTYSVGRWLVDVAACLDKISDRPIIFVGGTGLYFQALLGGFAQIPSVPLHIRETCRQDLNHLGAMALYRRLQEVDSVWAAKISPQDGQRILRGLEVYIATGKSLSFWQQQKLPPLLARYHVEKILLIPERKFLYERINERFKKMVMMGALEEAAAFQALGVAADRPAAKAIGLPELLAHLSGASSLQEALEQGQQQTRRYAKRQMTWFRHQMDETWQIISS